MIKVRTTNNFIVSYLVVDRNIFLHSSSFVNVTIKFNSYLVEISVKKSVSLIL